MSESSSHTSNQSCGFSNDAHVLSAAAGSALNFRLFTARLQDSFVYRGTQATHAELIIRVVSVLILHVLSDAVGSVLNLKLTHALPPMFFEAHLLFLAGQASALCGEGHVRWI